MRLASSAVLALTLFATPARAQTDPPVRPLASGTDMLARSLRDLGYEPKALSPDVFQVTVERDRWPVHIMTSLSTDGRRVWLESKFAPVDDPDKVPPATWKRLLEANEKIGPAHFAFDRSDRRVHLYKSFDNQDLTADRLKHEIEHFDTTVRKTQEYWRGENFKPAAAGPMNDAAPMLAPAVPAVAVNKEIGDASRLVGEWRVTEIQVDGRKTPDDVLAGRGATVAIRGDAGKVVAELRITRDRARSVAVETGADSRVDFVDERTGVEQGIYKRDGDQLTLCFAAPGDPRPTGFTTTDTSRNWLIVLKRTR